MILTPWVNYFILGALGVILPIIITLWVFYDEGKKLKTAKRKNNIND